jgi:hypothetical protein
MTVTMAIAEEALASRGRPMESAEAFRCALEQIEDARAAM